MKQKSYPTELLPIQPFSRAAPQEPALNRKAKAARPCPHPGEQCPLPFRQDPPQQHRARPGPRPAAPYHGPAAGPACHGPVLRGVRHGRTCGERRASACGTRATAIAAPRAPAPGPAATHRKRHTAHGTRSGGSHCRMRRDATSRGPRGCRAM